MNVTGDPNLTLEDVDIACAMVADEAHPDANIIFGASFDPTLEDEMRITIIATGFESAKHAEPSDGDRPAIPQKPTPMPSHTNFATGSYSQAGGLQTGFVAPQPTPRPTTPTFTAPAEPVAEPEIKEPEIKEPTPDVGHVSDDDFGLIMDILNRSKKK